MILIEKTYRTTEVPYGLVNGYLSQGNMPSAANVSDGEEGFDYCKDNRDYGFADWFEMDNAKCVTMTYGELHIKQ